uniref:Noggin-like protein 1 n=1 Tax=Schmidtea mediterranea TaxID=79327 RepID=A8SLH5_SCHMD|nr:noggin-like protein 1 [Schmidtea mediterranea]
MVNSVILIFTVWNILREPLIVNTYYSGSLIGTGLDRSTPDPHKPGENALDVHILQRILGLKNYEHSWMSMNTPSIIYEQTSLEASNNKQLDVLLSFKNLSFTDEKGQLINTSQNLDAAIRRWMVQQATCKTDYIWKRLDETHWPSWIKHGICSSTEPCSWPPGMACKQSDKKTLKVLKWTCLSDPLGEKWNAFRELMHEDRKRRRLRRHQFKRHLSQKRKIGVKKVKKPKQLKRLVKRYLYKTSKYASGYLCQWKPIDYTVYESCTCSC